MAYPDHVRRLVANLREVRRLTAIHTTVAGSGPGHKHDVEVLNKSAVVLLVACWEAFVEDLATVAFNELLAAATTPSIFPARVLALASKPLREDADERRVWELAGDGWKQVLVVHREKVIAKIVSPLNTPRAAQCDKLFESLLGIRLSCNWHWRGMAATRAQTLLDELITLRGEVAHRVAASRPVRKKYVRDMSALVARLSAASHNAVTDELERRIGKRPWRGQLLVRPRARR